MDGTRLQAKVYGGFAKAAQRVGTSFDIYRPTSATNPLATGNKVGSTPAAFSVHGGKNFNFEQPSDWQKPAFHALLDPDQVHVGDYLVSLTPPFGPFFIASKDPAVPVLAVQCNRVLTILEQGSNASVGLGSYGGNVPLTTAATAAGVANETAIMTGWPASILMGARGRQDMVLPGNDGAGTWRVLMPAYAGVTIKTTDMVRDDLGNRYAVLGAELQDLGWRMDVKQVLI